MPKGIYERIVGRSYGRKKGSKNSTETRERIRKSKLGNKNNLGKHWECNLSIEQRKKRGLIASINLTGKTNFANSGERNYKWIKDRTKLKKSEKKHLDVQYKYWMLEVKKRDKWKCRLENGDCNGRLESHHILDWVNYPELRYDIDNGITLCKFHHPRGRKKEEDMVPMFKNLLL